MATSYKVLAQSNPSATTETTLYTTTSGSSGIVSTIAVCNQASSAATYRIAIRPAADGSTTAKHWIVYGATVPASDSVMLTVGITMAAGDKIQIYASSANLSFSAFGSEVA